MTGKPDFQIVRSEHVLHIECDVEDRAATLDWFGEAGYDHVIRVGPAPIGEAGKVNLKRQLFVLGRDTPDVPRLPLL